MFKTKLMLMAIVALLAGCSYPAAVVSNLLAGVIQGGLSNPTALLSGALTNGLFNVIGLLPMP